MTFQIQLPAFLVRGRRQVEAGGTSTDVLHQLPKSLRENGGIPPVAPEPRPRRQSRKQLLAEMEQAAQESFRNGRRGGHA